MPRPKKEGLDYFSHDCDASHDEKIEAICSLYGKHVGYSIVFRLYERIYRAGGRLDISDAETVQILCKNVAEMDTETFHKFLTSCSNLKIFDKKALSEKVLTSNGILKRCFPVLKKREDMAKLHLNRVSSAETLPETKNKLDKA